ncbi:hypothetical protein [Poseidonibacter antarcticus]|nr:hypothetical protein [Poseidonibacter antarcticus]
MYRTKNKENYQIDFDYKAINKLQEKRISGVFTNGCFSKELDNAISMGQY